MLQSEASALPLLYCSAALSCNIWSLNYFTFTGRTTGTAVLRSYCLAIDDHTTGMDCSLSEWKQEFHSSALRNGAKAEQ